VGIVEGGINKYITSSSRNKGRILQNWHIKITQKSIGVSSNTHQIKLIPRVIRAGAAPTYLGMDRNRFNREVKPFLLAVSIGNQGIGYDRLDLDAWWEQYKRRNGRPGAHYKEGDEQWEEAIVGYADGQINRVVSGTSRRSSTEKQFMKAVEQATKRKQKGT
jgi:hypothetical protein